VFDKANDYFAAGANRVWLVYPNDRAVYVLRLNEDGGMISHRYGVDDTLDGGNVLPGFTLKVSEIFP
jgi:Uma2 family endonuclease